MADHFKILGWSADRQQIHYQHRKTGQIDAIKAQATAGPLLKLAPLAWWADRYPSNKGNGFDPVPALNAVIQQADAAGVYSQDRERGRGVWMDASRVVWHLGDRLEVDGRQVELIDHETSYHYQRLPRLGVDPATTPLSDAVGQQILKAVRAMGWVSPMDHVHLLGWILLANVGGALHKRPVLQITSHYGSGKSHTINAVIAPLLAGLAISQSNSSEAAIRQTLKTDTLPVLIDESEAEDKGRRNGHLQLMRLSFDGQPTSRGTTNGKALTYALRSSIALVGINATIVNPADRSRAVVVGRQPLPQEQWASVDQKLQELLTADTGAQLLRRCVNNLHTLRANVAIFRKVVEAQLPPGAAARAGDTYGALLAGAHLLLSTEQLDNDRAVKWLDQVGWNAATALGVETTQDQSAAAEGAQCLAKLLSHEEQWRTEDPEYGTGKISIRELLELARCKGDSAETEQARKALGRRGIKATDHALVVANNPELLAAIYGNTKWCNGGHRERLRDLPGAAAAGAVHIPVVGSHKATSVPWSATWS